jgi:hypothetical protein
LETSGRIEVVGPGRRRRGGRRRRQPADGRGGRNGGKGKRLAGGSDGAWSPS